MKKAISLATCAALLAGCSNIGTVNGVPVAQDIQASTRGEQAYCEANPAICIIGGAVAAGVLGYIINEANDGGGSGDTDDDVDV